MSRPIVVLDTETATAHGPPHIIEIGAVRVVDGEIVEHFQSLVRPEVVIDPEAFAVHGIGDDDVRNAPVAAEVLAQFARFARGDWLAAHNARVDARVLGFEAARHGQELSSAPLLDTLKLARRVIPEASDHKLETLTRHLELEVDVFHRALPDAVSCWKVLEECLERLATNHERGDALDAELLARAGSSLTLASARPRSPRISPRLRALETACRERSNVTVVYDVDGSAARLPVAPRLLFTSSEKGYLEAECLRSGTIKTYRLDRVQRVLTG